MRILSAAIIAALFASGSIAAYAQEAAPAAKAAPAKSKCKGKAEAECVAPDCKWTAGTGTAKGKCTKAKAKK